MAREPMNQNQKFALVVFVLVLVAVVVGVYLLVNGSINAML